MTAAAAPDQQPAVTDDAALRRPARGHARRAFATGAVMALALIAIGLGAYLFIQQGTRSATAKASEEAEVAARLLEQFVLRTLDGIEANFTLMHARLVLEQAGDTKASDILAARLAELAAAGRLGLVQVADIAPDGRVRWSSVQGFDRVDVSDREHVRVHLRPDQGLFVSEPVVGRLSGRRGLQVTRRMEDAAGALIGIAVISIDPGVLSAHLARIQSGPNDQMFLLRADGTVLARSDAAEAGPERVALGAEVDRALAAGRGAMIRGSGPLGGPDRFIALRSVPGTPLVVGAGVDAGSALAPVQGLAQLTAMAAILTSLVVMLLALVVRRRNERLYTRAELQEARLKGAAAATARQEIEALLAGLPIAVYRARVDAGGGFRLTYASTAMETLPVAGTNPAREAFLADLFAGRDAAVEYEAPRPGRTPSWMREAARVVAQGPEGVEVVGYRADITAERIYAAQAAEASKLATLGEMATGLAHELNQPVTAMALGADNAADALETEGEAGIVEAVQTLRDVAGQALRAQAIIDHLRVFGRRDPGPLAPIALDQAVEGALVIAGSALRAAGIQVLRDIPPDLPPVRGQIVLIEQVLVNLFLNARDAMAARPPGERRLSLAARAPAEGQMQLMVRDSGGGIAPEVIDRVFEPFFTTKPVGQGTGLGLAICHGMMAAIGGGIRLANVPGGAEVVLDFMAAEPEDDRRPASGHGAQPAA
ncbi:sensor histidine kinase [Roseomonas sp. HF4]|uniref:sensor histidine kinase n=1 Tax=Roseomonas sp. HF4 TaxID=2562313 RepID=UPI001485309E|nr:sensor histidine kinase [Roseomonas sp. HF4]